MELVVVNGQSTADRGKEQIGVLSYDHGIIGNVQNDYRMPNSPHYRQGNAAPGACN
jgi:hypothetical protein